MAENDKNSALDLISEILDKLIDTQQASTEATTSLKNSMEDAAHSIREVASNFKNGFRSELKKHIDDAHAKDIEAIDELKDEIKELAVNTQELTKIMQRPWTWIKLILTTVGATAGAIGAVTLLVLKVMSLL